MESTNNAILEAATDTATTAGGAGGVVAAVAAAAVFTAAAVAAASTPSSQDDLLSPSQKQAKNSIANMLKTEQFYTTGTQSRTALKIVQVLEANSTVLVGQEFLFYWKPQEARSEIPLVIFLWHGVGDHMCNRIFALQGDAEGALETAVKACSQMMILAAETATPSAANSSKKPATGRTVMTDETIQWLIRKCTAYRVCWKELEQVLQQQHQPQESGKDKKAAARKVIRAIDNLLMPCSSMDLPPTKKDTKRQIVLIFNEDPFYHQSTKVKTAKHILELLRNFPELVKDKFPFFWLPREKRARAGTCFTIFVWNNLGEEVWNECLELYPNPTHALVGTVKGLSNLLKTDHCTLIERPFLWMLSKCQQYSIDPSPLINALLANRDGLRGNPKPLLRPEVLQTILDLEPSPALDFAILFKDGHSLESLERVATRNPLFSSELVLALSPREEYIFCQRWAGIVQHFVPHQLTSLEVSPTGWTLEGFTHFLAAITTAGTITQSNDNDSNCRFERIKIKVSFLWIAANQEACAALKEFFQHLPSSLKTIELVGTSFNHYRGTAAVRDQVMPRSAKAAYEAILEGLATAASSGSTSREEGSPTQIIDTLHMSHFNQLPAQFVAQLGNYTRELHLKRNRLCSCATTTAATTTTTTNNNAAVAATAANDDNANNVTTNINANANLDGLIANTSASRELMAKARAWKDVANHFDVQAIYDHHHQQRHRDRDDTNNNNPLLLQRGGAVLVSLTLTADTCAGYFDTDVTRGIIGVTKDQPLEYLYMTARFTHGRYGSRHSHRMQASAFCEALKTQMPTLQELSMTGVRLCHDNRSQIPSLFLEAAKHNKSLNIIDVCDGKEFIAWDQIPYLKDNNFIDYRTAIQIWCTCVVRRYSSLSTTRRRTTTTTSATTTTTRGGGGIEDLVESIVDLPKLCLRPSQDQYLSTDIRKLRACKTEEEVSGKVPWIEGPLQDDSVLDPFISPIYELLVESPDLWCLQHRQQRCTATSWKK